MILILILIKINLISNTCLFFEQPYVCIDFVALNICTSVEIDFGIGYYVQFWMQFVCHFHKPTLIDIWQSFGLHFHLTFLCSSQTLHTMPFVDNVKCFLFYSFTFLFKLLCCHWFSVVNLFTGCWVAVSTTIVIVLIEREERERVFELI